MKERVTPPNSVTMNTTNGVTDCVQHSYLCVFVSFLSAASFFGSFQPLQRIYVNINSTVSVYVEIGKV